MKQPLDDPAPPSQTYGADLPTIKTRVLSGAARTEIAIIGAGITGISAALHLAERGHQVTVVESGDIANGGSGRALGLVLPHHKLSPQQIVARYGEEAGMRMVTGILSGPALVSRLVQQHSINCDLTRGGWIMGAHAESAEDSIRNLAASWSQFRNEIDLLGPSELRRLTGSSFYLAGLHDRRALGLNPRAYTMGLALAAQRAGVLIATTCRVTDCKRSGEDWLLRTKDGELRTRWLVVATDAYADQLFPSVRRAILPIRAYQLVSNVVPEPYCSSILPGKAILTDSRRTFGGVRLTPSGQLQLSVNGPPAHFAGGADHDSGVSRLRELYPDLQNIDWKDEWSGWLGMTRSHLPHLWQPEAGMTVAVGMNGRGIAMATLLGREIAAKLTGKDSESGFMPLEPPKQWNAHALLLPAVEVATQWYRLRDCLDLKFRYSH